jgi:hypothetical protein
MCGAPKRLTVFGVSTILALSPGLWIRIGSRFSDFVDPDPYWESGFRGKKVKKI